MSWYRTGTVAVTNGGATVTGTGTAWVNNVLAGDAIHLPDGKVYEITGIVSNTQLTVAPNYLGSTASGQAYAIQPTRGWLKRLNDTIATWLAGQQGYIDGPLAGRFGNGTAALPAVAALADLDTGMLFPAANTLAWATGGVERLRLTAAGLLTGGAITQTADDATAGRLLKTGDFGLGRSGSGIPVANIDLALTAGHYITNASTVGTMATAISPGGYLEVMTYSGTGAIQRWTRADTESLGLWERRRLAGSWGAWRQITAQSVVGPVGQSGGALTGAVIERGGNANGEYTRWADGTQICWHSMSSSNTADATWTHPAAFATPPMAVGTAVSATMVAVMLSPWPTATSAAFSVRDPAGARVACNMRLMAMGRWY